MSIRDVWGETLENAHISLAATRQSINTAQEAIKGYEAEILRHKMRETDCVFVIDEIKAQMAESPGAQPEMGVHVR